MDHIACLNFCFLLKKNFLKEIFFKKTLAEVQVGDQSPSLLVYLNPRLLRHLWEIQFENHSVLKTTVGSRQNILSIIQWI